MATTTGSGFGRWMRWTLRIAGVVAILVGGTFLLLTRTDAGAAYTVDRLIPLLGDRVRGRVSVERVTTGDLLRGATLHGVAILDPSGRPFARVDSLRARYSLADLLRDRLVFRDVRLWGPELTVERLPEWERVNAIRIFPSSASGADTARSQPRVGAGGRIAFHDVRIERGRVRVQLPHSDAVAESDAGFYVDVPGGGRLRSYAFHDVSAELPRVLVAEPGVEGEEVEVNSLSMVAEAIREPVRIENLRGGVRRVGSSVVVRASSLRLPDSELAGTLRASWAEDRIMLAGDLRGPDVALDELRWLVPDLPEGRGRADRVAFELGPDGSTWDVEDGVIRTPESRVEATGGLDVGDALRFRGMSLRAAPLAVFRINPWLPGDTLPLVGEVRGDLELDGTPDALTTGGRLTLEEPGYRSTTSTFSGTLRLGDGVAASGFEVVLDPLDWRMARHLAPDLELPGEGRLELDVDGRLSRGISLTALARHEAPGVGRSRVDVQGTVRADASGVHLDLDADVDPLRFAVLRPYLPEVDLGGEVEGVVRLRGPLGDLRVEAELETEEGELAVDTRFDVRDPATGYRLDGELRAFRLSGLFPSMPDPTRISGSVALRGSGLSRETLAGEARVRLAGSRIGLLEVDSAEMAVATEGGTIRIDTVHASTNLARIDGGGRLGLTVPGQDVELRLTVVNDSLVTARPLLYGDTVIAGDRLSRLDEERLVSLGVDPDTLPNAESVALAGRIRAEATLTGAVDDFDVEGSLEVREIVHGPNYLHRAEATFSAAGLPGLEARFAAAVTADSIRWQDRRLSGGHGEIEYRRSSGRASIEIRRSDREDYRGRIAFETDSLGGEVHLDEMVLRFDSVRWNLGGPTSVRWSDDGFTVNDFRLIRPGTEGMRIRADGRFPFRGEADFELSVERLPLHRVTGLLQSPETLRGAIDMDFRIEGRAASPRIEGSFAVDTLTFRNLHVQRFGGQIQYRDRTLTGQLEAWRDAVRIARVEGDVPVDLALHGVEDRIPAEAMNLTVVVDSFPASVLATVVEAVERVEGTVSGEVHVGGTPDAVQPAGSFRLHGGGFRLPGLGIQPSQVSGTVELEPDAVAQVDLQARSAGRATIQGTVTLNPLTDPLLDLAIQASGFQAVDRRDLSVRLGGETRLTGSFLEPLLEGSVDVSRGSLFLEEFERSAEVVDLADPTFFDVVDTTTVSAVRPVLQASQNPFLQNLRVNVEVQVERNTWLRSRDMNVEMGGELTINFDRSSEELVLLGQLNAIRGTYSAFGRQFQVREGTVEFVGTPGLNPNLSIGAITRLRTSQGEPLTITATVSGTLTEPRVSLSSDAQPPIAPSDLVSYLIFGRPSYALGSGETAVLQGAAGQIVGAAGSQIVGALTNQLGSAFRETGLADYFAVTEAPGGSIAGTQNPWASTQVEAGWYLDQNFFLALTLRPLADGGTAGQGQQDRFAGARVEWRLGDVWTVEGFVEDQFSRQGISGFGNIGFNLSQIFGFFIYRDWGY